ncbi:hypothetical protein BC351_40130 [Paenibacillus ferrarius]|uniref:Uncharacterized protein n=2 Tax=Paenibacillus TaxID=44249 RepID=A0A1V4H874_9BACL|nr:hypothetical protein BC351_40130 [Paenibacillus ferrarius]
MDSVDCFKMHIILMFLLIKMGWAKVMTNQKKSIKSAKQNNQKPNQNSSKKSSSNNGIDDANINSGG